MNQECRSRPKRDHVRQRIEFASEGAFHASHSRHAAIEQVEDASQQNEPQGDRYLLVKIALAEIRLDDLRQRDEPAEQVACRQ